MSERLPGRTKVCSMSRAGIAVENGSLHRTRSPTKFTGSIAGDRNSQFERKRQFADNCNLKGQPMDLARVKSYSFHSHALFFTFIAFKASPVLLRSSTLRDLLSTVLNQLTTVRFSLPFLVAFQCAISFFCSSIWQKRNWRINRVSASENQASSFPRVALSKRKTLLYFPRAGRLIGYHVYSSRRICFRAGFAMTCLLPSSSATSTNVSLGREGPSFSRIGEAG